MAHNSFHLLNKLKLLTFTFLFSKYVIQTFTKVTLELIFCFIVRQSPSVTFTIQQLL